jgi:hypothetical protein
MDTEMFRAVCAKVPEEKDPQKLEILKQRLRLLLMEGSVPRPNKSAKAGLDRWLRLPSNDLTTQNAQSAQRILDPLFFFWRATVVDGKVV